LQANLTSESPASSSYNLHGYVLRRAKSNTPESSRCHGIGPFPRTSSTPRCGSSGADRNGLLGDPLAVAASLQSREAQSRARKPSRKSSGIFRASTRIGTPEAARASLAGAPGRASVSDEEDHLPRLPEMTQAPERFLADRLLEAIQRAAIPPDCHRTAARCRL